MPGNRDATPDTEAAPAPERGGLTDPATWVAVYMAVALVLLIMIRRGFRPVLPG